MIGQEELSESARYLDALSEEHSYTDLARMMDIDPEGLIYVAEQRALRAAMLMDSQDPTLLSRTEVTSVKLSLWVQKLMPTLTSLAMDGINIGIHSARQPS